MKTRQFLNAFSRCAAALLVISMAWLAAGCAWLLMPPRADAAELLAPEPDAHFQVAYMESRLLLSAGQTEQALARLENCRALPDCPPKVYSLLAEGYIRQRSLEKVGEVLGEGLKKYPADYSLMLLQARFDAQQGRLDQGLATLEKAFKMAPHRQGPLELMSEMRLQKLRQVQSEQELAVQVEALIQVYERMLEARQGIERIPPLLVLSSLYLRTPNKARGVETAREAVQIHPREARCHLALGAALEELGRNAEALKAYREVLLRDSSNKDAHRRIQKLIAAEGKPDARRQFYSDLARDFPEDKDLQVQYAQVLMADKRWTEAEAQLKTVTAQWPDEGKDLQVLYAQALMDDKRWAEAEAQLKTMNARWPDDVQIRLIQVRAWVALKRTEAAVEAVQRLSRDNKKAAPLAHLTLAESLIEHGNRDRALAVLDDYLKTGPSDNENVVMALGSLLLETGAVDRAIVILEDFHKHHAGHYLSTLLMVQAYAQKKRFDDALAILTALPESVQKEKENDILHVRADLYRRQKKLEQALEILTTLRQRDKTNVQLVIEAGTINQDLGRLAEAERLYRQAIEMNPDEAETYNTLGYFYAETRQNLDEALKLVNKALKLKPNAGNIVDSLGWILYQRGDFQGAVEQLKRAVELMARTPDPVVFEHLGDAYEKLGRLDQAREAWRKSLKLDGESKQVRDKLARIGQ